MSTIQSRTPKKKAKKECNIDLKISMKILFHYPLTFPFLKTFPTKIKPTKCPASGKKMRQEKPKKRVGEKEKSIVQARTKRTKMYA